MCTLLTLNICLMCHTQELNLYGNQIGDAGLTALAKAVESGALDKLTVLHLGFNQITDDGFATLMPFLKKGGRLSNLTEFSIGSGVTDKGMKEFADILSSGALAQCTYISLFGNPGNSAPVDDALEKRKK